ncbi:hypothetical protein LTR66_001552 [Elasticomyces elasticus]|nr:hypothetical protein LTR66_001552 [Elasticomyces elasticus]
MRTVKLINDGLWHCLCPTFSKSALAAPVYFAQPRVTTVRKCFSSRRCASNNTHHFRNFSTSVQPTQEHIDLQHASIQNLSSQSDESVLHDPWDLNDGSSSLTPSARYASAKPRPPQARENLVFENESTPFLYEKLRVAASYGRIQEVERIVQHLVKERGEEPNLRLYSALILGNVHYEDGAAWRVANLLEEMKQEGLRVDGGICHNVLKVLSVHVDYLFRNDILDHMRHRWFQLTEDGHHDVAAGLFREGQFELALDRLVQMRKEHVPVRPWLYDIAVYMLSEAGEIDEALRLMKLRQSLGESNISKNVWYFLLDAASSAFHYPATIHVWRAQVIPSYINPPSGMCLNVLTTASRVGDAQLATDVFRILGNRSTIFAASHYDMLLTTYLAADSPDLHAALSVLSIMTTAKLEPNTASTRPLFLYLRENPALTEQAFQVLNQLHASGRQVPTAALNVVIEAFAHQRNLKQALMVYKMFHTFAPSSHKGSYATIETFNLLLRGCSRTTPAAHGTALFLASELLALRVQPDAMTYDRLILTSCMSDHLEHGYKYFDEMVQLKWAPRAGTVSALAIALAEKHDPRCWDVLQLMNDRAAGAWEGRGDRVRKDVDRAWSRAQQSIPGTEEDLGRADE